MAYRDVRQTLSGTSPAVALQDLLEVDLAASARQRPGLVGTLLPTDEVDDAEGGGDAAVPVPVKLSVYGIDGEEHVAGDGTGLPAEDGVALAHGLQVLHQGVARRIIDDDVVNVDRDQAVAGPLQQPAHVSDVGQRRHARTEAAAPLELGQLQRRAQLEQRVSAEHRRQERTVRLQDPVHLGQQRRQVVDPVQTHRAQHGVKRVGLVRQVLDVVDDLSRDRDLVVERQRLVSVE